MILVNRVGDSITGSVNMEPFGVKYTEEKFNEMMRLKGEAEQAVSMDVLKGIVEQFHVLTKEDYKGTVETVCPDLHVNEGTGKFFLKLANGKISTRAIPQPLVERILTSVEKKIDVQPIIKACIRFMRNPNFTQEKFERFARYINYTSVNGTFRDELIAKDGVSIEVATERATVPQTPITQEGLIGTYKVSRELMDKFDSKTGERKARYDAGYDEDTGDQLPPAMPEHVEDRVFYPAVQGLNGGDAFFCEDTATGTSKEGHLIRVGARHYLKDWKQVNTNDHTSCVKGLHVGNLDYIRGYEGGDTVTHNVFVDPMHIGAITDDGSGALRVLEYYVHSSKAGDNRGIYHSSTYAAMTDAQWEVMKEEAMANSEEVIKQIDDRKMELDAL